MAPAANIKLRFGSVTNNPLLQRKQLKVLVSHDGVAPLSRNEIRERISKQFKVPDMKCVIVGGFKTKYGGCVTKGFALIYDSFDSCKKYEQTYRLVRMGCMEAPPAKTTRRARKDLKTRRKKVRGTAKAKVSGGKK